MVSSSISLPAPTKREEIYMLLEVESLLKDLWLAFLKRRVSSHE